MRTNIQVETNEEEFGKLRHYLRHKDTQVRHLVCVKRMTTISTTVELGIEFPSSQLYHAIQGILGLQVQSDRERLCTLFSCGWEKKLKENWIWHLPALEIGNLIYKSTNKLLF